MAIEIVPTVIYSAMMGMTVFALVDVASRPKQRQSVFLAGLLILLLAHILGELFIYSGAYQYAPALAGMQFPLRVLLGPALYFYAHATMSPEKSLPAKSYLIALLGPVIVITAMLPFILTISPEEKLAMADPATRDPELFKIAVYTCLFSMFAFITFTSVYFAVTFKLQNQHRKQLMERFSSIEKRSMDWFKRVLIIWGIVWSLFALEYTLSFFGVKWFGSGFVMPILEATALMTFSHYALKQPILKDAEKAKAKEVQPRTRLLDLSQMELIAKELKLAMQNDALYLEEELSLKRLSDAVSVSENHISETLSQYLKTNFFQFVNSYRVEEAKKLLTNSDKNVSSIAYDVGFNSKSTFNAAFKRMTNLTPSAYRNQSFS